MTVLLDNGHGQETSGKRSPDGLYREYQWTRKVVRLIKQKLDHLGIKSHILVPEESDISLSERVKRVNEIYAKDKSCILISMHSNAAGDGTKWVNARGWSAYTSPGKTESDKIAEELYNQAKSLLHWNRAIRTDFSDGDSDYEAKFYILVKTHCPAVLIENFFHDNEEDCSILLSEEGTNLCARIVSQAIKSYIDGKHSH